MASETSSEHRREHEQEERGAHEVEDALDREVHALEHRRLELEERQRLAGHELDPVHEDLHRGRRHAHAHAVAVAAVHELHGLVLGEVGVGDQHLVDGVEVALELLERVEVEQSVGQRGGRARDEPVGLDHLAVAQRVSDTASMFGPEPTSTARRRYPAARSTIPLTRSNTQRAADT